MNSLYILATLTTTFVFAGCTPAANNSKSGGTASGLAAASGSKTFSFRVPRSNNWANMLKDGCKDAAVPEAVKSNFDIGGKTGADTNCNFLDRFINGVDLNSRNYHRVVIASNVESAECTKNQNLATITYTPISRTFRITIPESSGGSIEHCEYMVFARLWSRSGSDGAGFAVFEGAGQISTTSKVANISMKFQPAVMSYGGKNVQIFPKNFSFIAPLSRYEDELSEVDDETKADLKKNIPYKFANAAFSQDDIARLAALIP